MPSCPGNTALHAHDSNEVRFEDSNALEAQTNTAKPVSTMFASLSLTSWHLWRILHLCAAGSLRPCTTAPCLTLRPYCMHLCGALQPIQGSLGPSGQYDSALAHPIVCLQSVQHANMRPCGQVEPWTGHVFGAGLLWAFCLIRPLSRNLYSSNAGNALSRKTQVDTCLVIIADWQQAMAFFTSRVWGPAARSLRHVSAAVHAMLREQPGSCSLTMKMDAKWFMQHDAAAAQVCLPCF